MYLVRIVSFLLPSSLTSPSPSSSSVTHVVTRYLLLSTEQEAIGKEMERREKDSEALFDFTLNITDEPNATTRNEISAAIALIGHYDRAIASSTCDRRGLIVPFLLPLLSQIVMNSGKIRRYFNSRKENQKLNDNPLKKDKKKLSQKRSDRMRAMSDYLTYRIITFYDSM